ncbi:hypothetical protein RGU70_13665 [Herbaspirillum sp. RTI4]|uniref:capsid staple protein n=1 Tax=Herbaspirillum sp. RTI4 TaxID=3048640 RepID=UPI002AB437B3|nr:hypothetical protein [Herbaspirillum sp. RTI4]MDY7579361.1 hypothetical protein [Herbaspirillum sp. RTI4]MEA9980275.1 hypothetical protein [Herbaspirillum sp. RTI4]
MAMIDMKMSAEEAKEQTAPSESSESESQYPYGLRVSLDDDALEKLGLTSLPAVGSKISFNAVAEVCGTSSYAQDGGEAETSLSLQITGMEVTSSAQTTTDAANALYGA